MPQSGSDAVFHAFLAEGRLMLQRARGSGRFFFYPRIAEPGTGDTDFDWVEASREGVVYSVTVVRTKNPMDDYSVALVDLAEGPRLIATVEGVAPEAVHIGMRVRATVETRALGPMIVFKPTWPVTAA